MGYWRKYNYMMNSFFYLHPLFRYEEFAHWKIEKGTNNPKSIQMALQYYVKTGRLLNIRRGLYAVLQPSENTDNVYIDPYLIAAKVTGSSVLAYHTALELHGVAYTVFDRFTFLMNQKIKPFKFQNHWFQATSVPSPLKKLNSFYEIEILNRQGLDIKVTTLERTFVDVLDRIESSGGWEEVVRSISKAVVLDADRVVEYCLKLNNKILAAKVGFFLEQRQEAFAIKETLLKQLLKNKPSSPQSLVRSNESGQFIKKWNLVMPIHVVKQAWNEPNDDF
jgi:predicted transcriptional regulator of viral defense system